MKYTDESLRAIAAQYDCSSAFERGNNNAYHAALARGIFPDITKHFILKHKRWSREKCFDVAQKCKSFTEFREKCGGALYFAIRNGFYSEIRDYFGARHFINKEWAFNKAKEYSVLKEFRLKEKNCYQYLQKNGWIEKACGHMYREGGWMRRKIYVFEFSDHCAYIGLTSDPRGRFRDHLTDPLSAVFQHLNGTGVGYTFKIVTDWLPATDAASAEGKTLKTYKENGWKILNKAPCGSLGTSPKRKYSLEDLISIAKPYSNRKDFKRDHLLIYKYASKYHCLDIVCGHMDRISPPRKYSIGELRAAAKKYTTRKEFDRNESKLYDAACRYGVLDDICSHMPRNARWT